MSKETLREAFYKKLEKFTSVKYVQEFIATGEYRQYELSQLDAFYAVAKTA